MPAGQGRRLDRPRRTGPASLRSRLRPQLEGLETRTLLTISVGDTTVTEIAGGTNALFVVSLSAPLTQQVTVDYFTADGTGVAGIDYTSTTGTVKFAPGQTAQVVMVPILDDKLFRPSTNFTLNLINPIGDTIAPGGGVGTATVIDNNLPPQVSIANFSQKETTSGIVNATATISLSTASGLPVVVSYSTADLTAHAGVDYTAMSGTVTLTPGETSQNISIPIIGSSIPKGNLTFAVNISSATNATVAVNQAIGTIIDANNPVGLSVSNASATQNSSTSTTENFTVSLASPSAQVVTVQYATADGTAKAGTNYLATSGTLTFQPGVTSQNVPVTVLPAVGPGPTTQFTLGLTNPVNSMITAATGTGTIVDNVPGPTLSINSVQVVGNPTTGVNAVFTISLSSPTTLPVTVNYATSNVTAQAGADYTATTGTATLGGASQTTTATVTVPVLPQSPLNGNTIFAVTLSAPSNATISAGQGLGTILNDNPAPFLVINNVSAPEAAQGSTSTATFNVTLSSVSPVDVTVNYATSNGTALAGTNYTAASGILKFPAGTTVQTIPVTISGSNLPGPDTNFNVTLSGATNATIAVPQGTGTILDQNPPPTVSVSNPSVTAPSASSVNEAFTVSLSGPSALPITVHYATSDITALAGVDYEPVSGTLTFAPGQTSQTINVVVPSQTVYKPTLTYLLTLSNPGNATLGTSQGTGTILSPVAQPSVSINDVNVTQPEIGTNLARFTVSLSAPSGAPVTVNYSTADGSATAASGAYTPTNGTLTFNPGQTQQTITVPVPATSLFETGNTFFVNLTDPTGASLGQAQGTATINSTIGAPLLSVSNVVVPPGATSATFVVTLSTASGTITQVNYQTADQTAVAGVEYVATSGTLAFAPGQTQETVTVPILNTTAHGVVTFALELSAAINASIVKAEGIATLGLFNPFAVTSTADAGAGSLRQAILQADAGTGPSTITFDFPGTGPFVIDVLSPLPTLTRPITIDGTSQPGYNGAPLVVLEGGAAGASVSGLTVAGGDSTIKGLAIDDFTYAGIFLKNLGGNVVQNNYLGIAPDGQQIAGNRYYGILLDNSPSNLIGGSRSQGNVISGNGLGGVYVGFAGSAGNKVAGNLIGTNAAGTASVPNNLNGVYVDNAPNNLIGPNNVISGNDGNGVQVRGLGSTRDRIFQNFIGINAAGTAVLPNGGVAIVRSLTGHPGTVVKGNHLKPFHVAHRRGAHVK